MLKTLTLALAALLPAVSAQAWEPRKPIEFVVTSGPGGGTDSFARAVQAIIVKHKLVDRPIIVTNKGGGSGAEGFVYGKGAAGDPHKLVFGTNNEYLLPFVANLPYAPEDLTPVAAMAMDEFVLWVNGESPYKTAAELLAAAKEKPGAIQFGGSQSKDVDQTLVTMVGEATGTRFTYIPFKSGNEAAVQLAGGHIGGNTNNPNENRGQWQAGMVRPLCVFATQRLPAGPKVSGDLGWADIPLCRDEGIPIDSYQMPRAVWLPGGVPAEATAFYTDLLRKVSETPEWQDYLAKSSQSGRFLTGADWQAYIRAEQDRVRAVYQKQGWLAG